VKEDKMKIKQEKVFKPLTITIETKEEYVALVQIVDEAMEACSKGTVYMDSSGRELARALSEYFTNDV